MSYLSSLLWLASWPVLIVISYWLVKFALKKSNLLETPKTN
jgi:hypothetical protein